MRLYNSVKNLSRFGLSQSVQYVHAAPASGRIDREANARQTRSARDSQRRFVSDALHKLRSPITTIRQHAKVALAYSDRIATAELAEVVLAAELRLQRLVEDLLLLARADEQVRAPRVPVALDDLALEEARRVRSMNSF